jgi:GT2 family glycosyltransferase
MNPMLKPEITDTRTNNRNDTPASVPKISVIIPVFGNVGDLDRLITALMRQSLRPYEIIIVDSSPRHLAQPPIGAAIKYINNPLDLGLSGDYNCGAQRATGDYLLLMQQDCLPGSDTDLEQNFLLLTLGRSAVTSSVTLPLEYWERYNFWGQALMARWVGTFKQGISGKFDLIRSDVFRKINGYDPSTFSTAGEDMDLCLRLGQYGEVFVAPTQVIHLHNQSKRTRCADIFKKHYQLAESFGALFRKWGFRLRTIPYASHGAHHLAKYLYLVLPFVLVFPLSTLVFLLVATNFTNIEVWRIKSLQKLIFLILNPALFLVGALGTLKGFITGKQRYSINK